MHATARPSPDPEDVSPTPDARPPALTPFRVVRLWPLLVIALGLAVFFLLDLDRFLGFGMLRDHRQSLLDWRDANYPLAILTFVLVYAVLVAFSVPGAVWISITGGFLFGTQMATVLVVIGATAGAVVLFLAARYALADYFSARTGGWMKKMEAGFRADAASYLLFLRLVPVFPFWLVNLVPALCGVRLVTFTWATALGIVPGTFVYCMVGNGLGEVIAQGRMPDLGIIFDPPVLGPVVGLALLSLLPVLIRRLRKGR